jgi:hypothetical protein
MDGDYDYSIPWRMPIAIGAGVRDGHAGVSLFVQSNGFCLKHADIAIRESLTTPSIPS